MLAILPDRFGNNDRCLFGDRMKYLDSQFLTIDKAMPFFLIEWMGSFYEKLFLLNRGDEGFLHRRLGRFTHLIRGQT
jgi:hypothetical protein